MTRGVSTWTHQTPWAHDCKPTMLTTSCGFKLSPLTTSTWPGCFRIKQLSWALGSSILTWDEASGNPRDVCPGHKQGHSFSKTNFSSLGPLSPQPYGGHMDGSEPQMKPGWLTCPPHPLTGVPPLETKAGSDRGGTSGTVCWWLDICP